MLKGLLQRRTFKKNTRGERQRRHGVAELFKSRRGFFYGKDRLSGEAYAGKVVDPFQVFGEEYATSKLNLIGQNWLDRDVERPVAMLWGFNNWKLGFVSDYLQQYRTVFAPRKFLPYSSIRAFRKFPVKPSAFIFWGMTEPWLVRWYARRAGVPIYRMEDGFLRSASLGASHSTPYSLVLDSRGIHYDPSVESDLEHLLNTYEFDESEIEQAKQCLALFSRLNLSKYNPPSFGDGQVEAIKIRRRVAVIGQVDNDMSVQLGNIHKWTMKELIQLAKVENPDAEVIYRPHPDVYKGFQKSRFKARSVETICTLANPDIPINDFLASVDHVYTVTSLAGLEAVMRGIKVTVVGAAFYAGWGLTDDRLDLPWRKRKRSLPELFAGVYLKYPRYLADLGDPVLGFNAASMAIKADYEKEKASAISAIPPDAEEIMAEVAATDHWPQIFFARPSAEVQKKSLSRIDFSGLMGASAGRFFRTVLSYAVCGQCADNNGRDFFLVNVRKHLDSETFGQLLLDLSKVHPGQYVATQLAWLLASVNEANASLEVLSTELRQNVQAHQAELSRKAMQVNRESGGAQPSPDNAEHDHVASSTLFTREQAELQREIFDYRFQQRDLTGAVEVAKTLLLHGYFASELIQRLEGIAELRFDDRSSQALARLSYYQQVSGQMAAAQARGHELDDVMRDPWGYVALLAKAVVLKPSTMPFALAMLKRFEDKFEIADFERMLIGVLALNGERSVEKAQALIAIEQPEAALRVLEDVIEAGDNSASTRVAYSQALSYAGRLQEAITLIAAARSKLKTSPIYRESLRLCVLVGDYVSGLTLMQEAMERRVEIGDMLPRKIYFGSRMPEKALRTFTEQRMTKTVQTYFKDKYLHLDAIDDSPVRLLLLAIFGPGDEIRFASIYGLLPAFLPNKALSITCDPRLHSLLARSFPSVEFVGVPRPRTTDLINSADYSRVPGSDISYVVNNVAMDKIDQVDRIMMVSDMLHRCLSSYEAFPGTAYLKANPLLVEAFRARLPRAKILVGLSWRSSLTTHSRNEHYLSVEELGPLLAVDGVQFVNLQYDDCREELAWIEQRYPGKIIDFADVDQYNDFESVAAIMHSMNLILAPATTVVELAGALGCPTWMLSNSSELHWRKIDELGTDVWHGSMRHIEGKTLGNKDSLVQALVEQLTAYVTEADELRSTSQYA